MNEQPRDWKERHRWKKGDEFELAIPADDDHRRMLLPVWGWRRARLSWRLTHRPADIETIDAVDYDVFEDTDSRVLVVAGFEGTEDKPGGDWIESRGARVWKAPPQVAEPPVELVDRATRTDVKNRMFDGIAPTETRWTDSTDARLDARVAGAEPLEFDELPHRVRRACKSWLKDRRWSWDSRGVTVDDPPGFAARFPTPRPRRSVDRWGVLYRADCGENHFWVALAFAPDGDDGFELDAHLIYDDEMARRVEKFGKTEGRLRALARRVFDVYAASMEGAVEF